MRNHNQDVYSLSEKIFSLAQLQSIVSVGSLDQNFGPQFFGFFHEKIPVPLPSFFFQSVHGEADFDFFPGRLNRRRT